jgi:serine protease Do
VIIEVEEGGPADKAGLKKGDIILEVDGENLWDQDFGNLIQSSEIGDTLNLLVWREGKELEIDVAIGDKGA